MSLIDAYVEEVGLFYEGFGLPRMSGRILGYLMATQADGASFDELQNRLKASKGAISGSLTFLLGQRLVEKYMKSGDRKSYYRFSTENAFQVIDQKITAISSVRKVFEGANRINDAESSRHHQINRIVDFYRFLESEIPKLKEKWRQEKESDA